MDAGTLRLGLIQMSCAADPGPNLEQAASRIEEAAGRGATVICLQELFRSQYFCQSERNEMFDLAEPIPGPTTERLRRVAAAHRVVVIAPVFERRSAGVYHNSAVVIDETGRIAGLYRKMHIPDDPGYYEKFYFAPGDLDFIAHRTQRGSLGVLICWDQWSPRRPASPPWRVRRFCSTRPPSAGLPTWRPPSARESRTHGKPCSAATPSPTVSSSRRSIASASRATSSSWGNSFVADPFGEVIARADAIKEEILVVDCDLNLIEETRRNWPFLRDRRIDAYHDLTRRFRS